MGEQTGHAFVGRIGQCNHRELLLRVDKPAVTVGAAPLKGAPGLRRARQRGLIQHRPAITEAPTRVLGLHHGADVIGDHQLHAVCGQDRCAALANGFQEPRNVTCRPGHASAAGRVGMGIKYPPHIKQRSAVARGDGGLVDHAQRLR